MMPGDSIAEDLAKIVTLVSDYTNTKKVYLAAPWFDEKARMLHDTVALIDNYLGDKSRYSIYYPKDNNKDTPLNTFKSNIEAIRDCDIVIALISRKDVGTAWEIGYASAIEKPVYLVTYSEECFKSKTNLMLAYSGQCFTIDKLAKFLTVGLDSVDYVQIERMWDDVE